MKNETSAVAGTATAKPSMASPPKTHGVVAPPAQPKNPVAGNPALKQPAPVAAPAAHSVPLFGGHRGGGKKRKDGLPAGSPEAIAADKERDAARQRAKRAAQKAAALPPALPSATAPPEHPADALAAGASAVPVPGLPAGAVKSPMPLFVAWSEKILARPVKLLTKIIDRLRVASLMKRVRKLDLTEKQQKEIEGDIKYKQELVDDFNSALSNTLTIELNRFNVPGAQHSHYIELVMTGGELALTHFNTVDKLEKMLAENAAIKKQQALNPPAK